MERRGVDEVPAVEAAQWLDRADLLADSGSRPGLPLRGLLRSGEIAGAEQRPPRPNGRWYIVRLGDRRQQRPDSRIEEGRSTVYVFGELEPRELALFSADEIRVDPRRGLGTTIEVIGRGIGYWSPDHTTAQAIATRDEGELMFQLIAAAYALLGGTPFRAQATGWVEARDVVGQATMMGFTSPRFRDAKLWDPEDPRNLAVRDAVAIAWGVLRLPLHRLALRDLHSAVLEPGDDAFVYAFRAVEAIRKAVAVPGPRKARWTAMHAQRRTSESELQELAAVSQAVLHPDQGDVELQRVRRPERRKRLLTIAREAVLAEVESRLGRSFPRLDTRLRRARIVRGVRGGRR